MNLLDAREHEALGVKRDLNLDVNLSSKSSVDDQGVRRKVQWSSE